MITFDVREDVSKTLQAKAARMKNLRAPLTQIGQRLVESTRRRIKTTKVDADGNAWAAWAPETLLARQRRGTIGDGLLYETGRLYRSISARINARSVTVNSSAPYARYHQLGTTKLPARPFIGLSKQDVRVATTIMNSHIRGDK